MSTEQVCETLDKWLAEHKPQTTREWEQQGERYLAIQCLQIGFDVYAIERALADHAKPELEWPSIEEQEEYWTLRDEGRSDGNGESYAERNI